MIRITITVLTIHTITFTIKILQLQSIHSNTIKILQIFYNIQLELQLQFYKYFTENYN